MTILPGSLACCGYDSGDSVEIDITSSDSYGYIQFDRGTSFTADRYACYVLAWKSPGSGLSLSSVTAPSSGGSWNWYCWTDNQTPAYDSGGVNVINGNALPCTNYATAFLLSSLRFTVSLRKRPPASVYDSALEVRTSGPRVFYKTGSSTVAPLSSSDALSSGYIATANAAGWNVFPPDAHFGSGNNMTTRVVMSSCTCSGRTRSRSMSPSAATGTRPKGDVLASLTSCNTPISIQESYAVYNSGTLQATTLTALTGFNAGMYALDWEMSIDAMRLLSGSSTLPLFADLQAGLC